jgi:DNA-directed RNA polymerase specialized sigma24 family protein
MQILNEESQPGKFRLTEKQEILIRNKVSALPRLERLAVYYYFWEQYSCWRIARNLCVPVDDVSNLIQSAMARLRNEFSEIADSYFGMSNTSKFKRAA